MLQHQRLTLRWMLRRRLQSGILTEASNLGRNGGNIPHYGLHETHSSTCRSYSNQQRKPNFITQFIDNIKQDLSKNKEMRENLKKFRAEAEKLEQSEALQKARAKYISVESEASVLKGKLDKVKDTVSGVLEEAAKTDIAKKAGQIGGEIHKSAQTAAEKISEKGQKLSATDTFKSISQATAAVRQELDSQNSQGRVYMAPEKLRKRVEGDEGNMRVVAADDTTVDIELHKDSRFYESWENFKNNNAYVNKVLHWKMQYEESENPVIRASRLLTDKVSDLFGGLFQKTELSETLTEIVNLDPSFDRANFLQQCERDIIPNILEAMIRGDLEILKDWCHEGPFNVLSTPIKQAYSLGANFDSKVLDIENLDLAMGKIMEQGPVLIITFTSQQILCVRDKLGKILEGDPDKVLRVNYVWALSRDRDILDPRAAWRLLDISASSVEQFV